MANEATARQEQDEEIRWWTCADDTAITKGTVFVVDASANRTAVAHSAASEIFAGIAIEDKAANDGQTRVSLQRSGLAEVVAGGTFDEGDLLKLDSTANRFVKIDETITSLEELKLIAAQALDAGSSGNEATVVLMGI